MVTKPLAEFVLVDSTVDTNSRAAGRRFTIRLLRPIDEETSSTSDTSTSVTRSSAVEEPLTVSVVRPGVKGSVKTRGMS